jgi:hypothetical protein
MNIFKRETTENVKPNSFDWANDGNYSSDYRRTCTLLGIFKITNVLKRRCRNVEQPKQPNERLIITGFTQEEMRDNVDGY